MLNRALVILLPLLLSACGGDQATTSTAMILLPASSTPPPAVPATPPPPPAPAPPATPSTATPPPTPASAAGDGKIVVVAEGDSISVLWSGNHTGLYGASRPDIELHGLAVGGSMMTTMTARIDKVLALKPDLVSILIGANDLGGQPSAQEYADQLKPYVDKIRATGAKVVVGTVLPQSIYDYARFNSLRKELAAILKAAPWIDGVADFGGDSLIGPDKAAFDIALYPDGLHPARQDIMFNVYKPAMDKLAFDVR